MAKPKDAKPKDAKKTPEEPILQIARMPPVTIGRKATVEEAVRAMVKAGVGAVAVVDGERLAGIFTERDLMVKVVSKGLDPKKLPIEKVMVENVVTLQRDARRGKALELMIKGQFRHIPVTEPDGRVVAMLSLRHLLQHQLERLKDELDSMEKYMSADGPGG